MAGKRKIPVRKHHGIRDPLKQLEQKEKKFANVTNNPPMQNDGQPSNRFKEFKRLADAAKTGKKIKIGSIGKEDKPIDANTRKAAAASDNKPKISSIKQFADETDEDYLRRVNRITSASIREAQYEAKYGVSVIRNPTTGEITLQKRPKNEIDELLKQKQKERRNAKNGRGKSKAAVSPAMDAKTRKELIKQACKEGDEENDGKDVQSTEYKRDVFKFGELVHAPPTLKTLPRKASKRETVSRPGRKSNLLLKSLMETTTAAKTQTFPAATSDSKKRDATKGTGAAKLQLKGKRKDLPEATRRMLESERIKLVALYRRLKKNLDQQQK